MKPSSLATVLLRLVALGILCRGLLDAAAGLYMKFSVNAPMPEETSFFLNGRPMPFSPALDPFRMEVEIGILMVLAGLALWFISKWAGSKIAGGLE
ncbi:MAG TPA: hypothetical protein VG733_09645 [Chthoniobacteraceae bacterium]|nr:hypothetical protein [Chthoniobacteraceae bacterium]